MRNRIDEVLYWNDVREHEYDEILSSDDFSGGPFLEAMSQSSDEEESVSKKLRLSPDFNHQEGDVESCSQSSPLGLTLRKTPSFLSLLETKLSKGKQLAMDVPTQANQESHRDYGYKHKTKTMDDFGFQSISEKLKASNFPALFIRIGTWQRISRHKGDLIAKLYYAKRKMVWEVLEGALKSKIEIQWSDIIAIRAFMPENEAGTLEIELNQPPLFYRETNPQPRKHTLWQQASDFTGGQAPLWRRHYVRFPPGVLDKHFEKLLQYDQRLFALSQKPFPSQDSPFFYPSTYGVSPFSISFNAYGSGLFSGMQYPYRNCHITPPRFTPHSPISVMDLSFRNDRTRNNQQNPNDTVWGQQVKFLGHQNLNSQDTTQGNDVIFTSQSYYQSSLDDITKHYLGDTQMICSNEITYPANVESMYSYLEPVEMKKENAIAIDHSEASYDQVTCMDEVMQRTFIHDSVNDGLYSEHCLPSHVSNDQHIVIDPMINNSIPSYVPSNPTNRDFF